MSNTQNESLRVRAAIIRVANACAVLEQHGCRIEAASAHARPFIRIDRVPPRLPEHQIELSGVSIVWRH